MDLSLLLLTTPMTPPAPPVRGVPRPAVGLLVVGDVLRPVPGLESRPPLAAPPLSRPPGPVWRCPLPAGPEMPGVPCWPTGMGWKSSLVIGSLYFLRRNRCSTSTLRFGG